jgi:hypothetical protein
MKPFLAVAALLAVLIGVLHSYLGERYLLIRLFRRENLPRLFGSDEFTKRTLRFAWHVTSIAWFGLAGILLLLARQQASPLAVSRAVAGTFLASALLAAAGSRGRHYSWVVFLAIAALAWLGA